MIIWLLTKKLADFKYNEMLDQYRIYFDRDMPIRFTH